MRALKVLEREGVQLWIAQQPLSKNYERARLWIKIIWNFLDESFLNAINDIYIQTQKNTVFKK